MCLADNKRVCVCVCTYVHTHAHTVFQMMMNAIENKVQTVLGRFGRLSDYLTDGQGKEIMDKISGSINWLCHLLLGSLGQVP